MATLEQIEKALRAADAAGNAEDARRLAQAYKVARDQQQPRADFSGVKSSVYSTERITSAPGAAKVEQPAAPKRGNAVTRFLGEIGGREVMQGAYGLYGALGGDALNQYVLNPIDRALFPAEQNLSGLITGEQPRQRHVFGIGNQSYRDAAAAQADEWGMRRPETATQKVVADIGEGLTGTALTMGVGGLLNAGRQTVQTTAPTVASRLGDFLTAQPVLQTVSTVTGTGAGSVARESGAGQGTQVAASLLGALAPGAASYGTGATVRGLTRGGDGAKMQQTIDDFAKLGATPSVGQASGNRMVQGAENLLAGGPTSAGVMGRFAEKQADQIGQGLQRQGERLMRNASGERAGRAIERGMDTFKGNTGATKRALYWQVDQLMPGQKPVNLSNTWREVVQLTTPTPGAQATTTALINPRIQQLRDTLQQDIAAGGGQISYEAMKRIRSDIGEAITDFSLSPDTPTRELKRLYGALSRDMEEAARAQGPAAVAAAKRANNYTRAVADRMETVQRVIDKNGGPEKVFEAAMAGTRDGGTTLRAVMQSLPQEGQKAVSAAVIKRMGLATPGAQDAAGDVFSAQTFLTNWNRVSPEAKRALFDRFGPQFSKDMDRVARVAQNIRDGSKVFANPSGTANRAAAMTYGASLVGSLFTGGTALLAGSGVGANLLARWMTNPATVRRLATVTALPKGSIPGAIQAMRQAAERDGDEDLAALADELESRESEAR